MPDIDEDILRQLMIRSTDDLFAPRRAVHEAIRHQRRRRLRTRVLAVAGTAAAAGLAVGTLATVSSSGSGARSALGRPVGPAAKSPTAPARPTAKETLLSLSAIAAATPRPSGRYAVQSELTNTTDVYPRGIHVMGANFRPTKLKHQMVLTELGKETTVIDTINGSIVTYDQVTSTSGSAPAPGWKPPTHAPTESSSGPGSAQTSAQLDALPTDPAKLSAKLLPEAKQEFDPHSSDSDLVAEAAAALLWDPNLSPAVRAAAYKVLAATPGVTVNTDATDSSGRTAVEISLYDAAAKQKTETFENPATGATLESATVGPAGDYAEDLYLSITYTDTIPANPYKG